MLITSSNLFVHYGVDIHFYKIYDRYRLLHIPHYQPSEWAHSLKNYLLQTLKEH